MTYKLPNYPGNPTTGEDDMYFNRRFAREAVDVEYWTTSAAGRRAPVWEEPLEESYMSPLLKAWVAGAARICATVDRYDSELRRLRDEYLCDAAVYYGCSPWEVSYLED